MWVLGTESESSRKATGVLNHRVLSPASVFGFLFRATGKVKYGKIQTGKENPNNFYLQMI